MDEIDKDRKTTSNNAYLMAAVGVAIAIVSLFIDGVSRSVFFIIGVVFLLVGLSMASTAKKKS